MSTRDDRMALYCAAWMRVWGITGRLRKCWMLRLMSNCSRSASCAGNNNCVNMVIVKGIHGYKLYYRMTGIMGLSRVAMSTIFRYDIRRGHR